MRRKVLGERVSDLGLYGFHQQYDHLNARRLEKSRALPADSAGAKIKFCVHVYIVEARKLEHHSPHALKVKYKGS